MNHHKVHDRYKIISLITASSEDIVKLLLRETINSLETAIRSIDDDNIQKRNESLTKAQQLILEMMVYVARDTESGQNLIILLDYINHSLILANLKKDKVLILEGKSHLNVLLENWEN
ncbi:flagellar export chaperone FliS [Robertmurraya massiliosenegalensis]|uniref:flagellar export chaperone FliS n=1 Tax=Robertmurraya massiliosenegalensis TaxID=1287657 RepID=UPI0011DCD3B6|nr:flagellar export chaperone FliS [Robertmurraya massiliosenegalensis]